MNKKLVFLIAMLVVLTLVTGAKVLPKGSAVASDDAMNHTISVTGTGSVSVVPDTAIISFGVFVDDKDPQVAMDSMSEKASKIVSALLNAGIKKENIKTTDLSLYPIYSWEKDTGKQILEGYRASESFIVKTEIEKAGKIVSLVNKSGANQINSISFEASNKDKLKLDAIEQAMADARAKAEAALKGTNYKITGIKTISVEASSPVYPVYKQIAAESRDAVIEGGTVSVDANVSVVFTFD